MNIILAPDSFKGTFTSAEVIDILSGSIARTLGDCRVIKAPVADGGEGTTEALVTAANGEYRAAAVPGALGGENVRYGVIWGDTAVVEMAEVCGIAQLGRGGLDPLGLSSFALGKLMLCAVRDGFKKILVGIGGSAINDGGMGMLSALGAVFRGGGSVLRGCGAELELVDDADLSGLADSLCGVKITVICDVTNPLLGKNGATFVYGPQKGAVGDIGLRLERGMENYADVLERRLGRDIRSAPGAGAAGGVGAALGGVCGAEIKNGIDTVLAAIHFDELLKEADLVVTGEGMLDGQSVDFGKVPVGIARHCQAAGVPVAVIAGALGEGWERILEMKHLSVMGAVEAVNAPGDISFGAEQRLKNAADRMFRFIALMGGGKG